MQPRNHLEGVSDTGSENLADPAIREKLTPAAIDGVVRLVEIWCLTSAEMRCSGISRKAHGCA